MLRGHTFKIEGERARFPSLGFGYGDSQPFVLGRTRHFMVLYRKPVKDWQSRGSTTTHPARYWLVEYAPARLNEPSYYRVVRDVATEEPGPRWQRVRWRLLDCMNLLEEKWS
jgi:hypothetical protein